MSCIKPILFNTEMVNAILDGRKTVTRRVIDKDISNQFDLETDKTPIAYIEQDTGDSYESEEICPYQVGDILYIRETWFYEKHMEELTEGEPDLPSGRYSHRYVYKADNPKYPVNIGVGATGWKPSIHMPKEAARIWLKVTSVKAELLQKITNEQAIKEGFIGELCSHLNEDEHGCTDCMNTGYLYPPIAEFAEVWDSTITKHQHKYYTWEKNPFVWVIEFERCDKPEEI